MSMPEYWRLASMRAKYYTVVLPSIVMILTAKKKSTERAREEPAKQCSIFAVANAVRCTI